MTTDSRHGGLSITRPTLVLNGAGQPLGAIPLHRAVSLTMTGRAIVLECDGELRSPSTVIAAPTVIVRVGWSNPPSGVLTRVTRAALFARDNWTCGWCGRHARPGGELALADLTVDHIVPQHRVRRPGEKGRYARAAHQWSNVVSACRPCNSKKGGEAPDWDALRIEPVAPSRQLVLSRHLARLGRGRWDQYLPAAA